MPSMVDHTNDVVPSVFSMIIAGDLPGRFVWRDAHVVVFLTINPIRPGHALVVPVQQIDKWTDVPTDLWLRMNEVALIVGRAQEAAFDCVRVGSIIAGLEVPHCHIHLIPIDSESDLSFSKADPHPTPESLDAAAEAIRTALRSAGHVPAT